MVDRSDSTQTSKPTAADRALSSKLGDPKQGGRKSKRRRAGERSGGRRVAGDGELLHRAFENVVRNAARYTPSGAQIRILGEYDALHREVRVTIADERPGVRTADLAFIFEPFFRGETAQQAVGHGLGLAITHRVIQSHGGRISASNRASGGLAVEICLPA